MSYPLLYGNNGSLDPGTPGPPISVAFSKGPNGAPEFCQKLRLEGANRGIDQIPKHKELSPQVSISISLRVPGKQPLRR